MFNAYAKAINKAYGRSGSLFKERFGRKEVEEEFYCSRLVCYLHTNAQKHGIVADFRAHAHNSYSSMLSSSPTMLLRDEVLHWFGGRDGFIAAHQGYVWTATGSGIFWNILKMIFRDLTGLEDL